MQRIIEFSHPGKQIDISRKNKKSSKYYFYQNDKDFGVRRWNNDNTHYRKFIKHKGSYVKSLQQDPIKDTLLFWGEWEGPSQFEVLLDGYFVETPDAIHQPFLSTDQALNLNHFSNTDPFVWLERFYYTYCKQPTYSYLRDMTNGSIILFGTEYAKGFALDTVCVIDTAEPLKPYLTDYAKFDDIYKKMFFERILYEINVTKTLKLSDMQNCIFYKGKQFSKNDAFSFSPCKVSNSLNDKGFSRVMLDYKKFELQNPGAGTVCYKIPNANPTEYWNKIVSEVLNQGYYLATSYEKPVSLDKLPLNKISL